MQSIAPQPAVLVHKKQMASSIRRDDVTTANIRKTVILAHAGIPFCWQWEGAPSAQKPARKKQKPG
ncbi:MAG TPA: hypothetical protein VFS02_10165 [Telluria sp.]|nr:hypothetical protein [Telluria sp.]